MYRQTILAHDLAQCPCFDVCSDMCSDIKSGMCAETCRDMF